MKGGWSRPSGEKEVGRGRTSLIPLKSQTCKLGKLHNSKGGHTTGKVHNTYLTRTRSPSSVRTVRFLGSYSVITGRMVRPCNNKHTSARRQEIPTVTQVWSALLQRGKSSQHTVLKAVLVLGEMNTTQ